jgi:DNA-3-methyladenine glycosylase II
MTNRAADRYQCTIACAARTGFTLTPSGPFSLELANGFGFGHRDAVTDNVMRLAFAADSSFEPVGVTLTQDGAGAVHGEAHGEVAVEAVSAQVARVLSLDHDGEAWMRIGAEDAALGRIQQMHLGLRPVLFNSPYEAAAWSVLSARQPRAHALQLRESIAERWGTVFDLAGSRMSAFPPPARLLEAVDAVRGLPEERLRRMRGVAEAALDGRMDAGRLQALGPEDATEEMLRLRGIGPFYASLIVVRATGFSDAFIPEPGAVRAAGHFGVLGAGESFEARAERWRPFRTWATVLLRYAGARAGAIARR